MEKKHKLKFNTDKGSLELETNDLAEVGVKQYLANFFSTGIGAELRRQEPVDEVDWEGIALQQKEQMQALKKEILKQEREKMELKESLRKEVEDVRHQVEEMKVIDEKDVEEISKEFENSQPPSDLPPRPQPGVRMTPPPSSFLDINPNQMNEQIWGSLMPEQQQQWLKKYNLA